jgi:hypothetical protein
MSPAQTAATREEGTGEVADLVAAWRVVELNFTDERIMRLALSLAQQRNSREVTLGRHFVSNTAAIPYGTSSNGIRRLVRNGALTPLAPFLIGIQSYVMHSFSRLKLPFCRKSLATSMRYVSRIPMNKYCRRVE